MSLKNALLVATLVCAPLTYAGGTIVEITDQEQAKNLFEAGIISGQTLVKESPWGGRTEYRVSFYGPITCHQKVGADDIAESFFQSVSGSTGLYYRCFGVLPISDVGTFFGGK